MSELIGQCQLCANRALQTCKLCGSLVCSEHFDSEKGICVSCKRGKR